MRYEYVDKVRQVYESKICLTDLAQNLCEPAWRPDETTDFQ